MSNTTKRFGDLLIELGLVTESQVQEALALQSLTGNRVGEALISLGYVTRAQLQRALSVALGEGRRVALARPPLGEILVGLKYLTIEKLEETLILQRRDGRKLGELLVACGACTHQQVYEGLGLQQRMASPEAENLVQDVVKEAAAAASNGIKVLVVDDSQLACNLVEQGLSLLGYEVHSAQDPFAALEQVDGLKPNIVLTDLDMPGIDGAELCRRLKNGPSKAIPVIILTANDHDAQRVSGLRAGADDYVNKGASMEELAARIDSVVRRVGETERVRRLFARYTSDAVVEEILRSGDVVLTGEKRQVTVLFADIRNFTSLSESLPAEQVMGILNEVLGQLADAVLGYGGTLDKFLGDGLMAVFGAPVRHDDDARRAVDCALAMMDAVRVRNGRQPAGGPSIELGIGINTGQAIAGSLGSARRTEYTCIGDAVNVASRLCSHAGPGEILVGEETATESRLQGTFESLPAVKLKGKALPVPLYKVIEGTALAVARQA
jgi:adenylate cyclase